MNERVSYVTDFVETEGSVLRLWAAGGEAFEIVCATRRFAAAIAEAIQDNLATYPGWCFEPGTLEGVRIVEPGPRAPEEVSP